MKCGDPSTALALLALTLSGIACAGRQDTSTIGITRETDATGLAAPAGGADEPGAAGTPGEATGSSEAVDPRPLISLDELAQKERIGRESERARTALLEIPAPDNDLGLVMSVSQRASDLLWLLAIENRGDNPARLLASPDALSFEVTPPGSDTAPASSKPTVCGTLPKAASSASFIELQPGHLLTYSFDPRAYCATEDVLVRGAQVSATYGFPLATRSVWRGGKRIEEVITQQDPFVAQATSGDVAPSEPAALAPPSPASTETPAPNHSLKNLTAPPFELDETYPLDAVVALPLPTNPDQDATEEGSREDSDNTAAPPPEPLSLALASVGRTRSPEDQVITARVRNTSGKNMVLFVRREMLTFQVQGPRGFTTCLLPPSDRAPDSAAFSHLPPGASRSLTTRLPEVCPQGTFDEPGTYLISARFDATISGRDHELDAFTGRAETKTPAKLEVLGDASSSRPVMRVMPRAAP